MVSHSNQFTLIQFIYSIIITRTIILYQVKCPKRGYDRALRFFTNCKFSFFICSQSAVILSRLAFIFLLFSLSICTHKSGDYSMRNVIPSLQYLFFQISLFPLDLSSILDCLYHQMTVLATIKRGGGTEERRGVKRGVGGQRER